MKNVPVLLLALTMTLAGCTNPSSSSPSASPSGTINGTWNLKSMGGYPMTGETIIVANESTFQHILTNGSTSGTVTLKGQNVYTLTEVPVGSAMDVTLASDGKTISYTKFGSTCVLAK